MSESASDQEKAKRIEMNKVRVSKEVGKHHDQERERKRKTPTARIVRRVLHCTLVLQLVLVQHTEQTFVLTYLSLKKTKAAQVIRDGQRNRFIEIRSCSDDGYSNNLHGLR
jgi:hypothetical protein